MVGWSLSVAVLVSALCGATVRYPRLLTVLFWSVGASAFPTSLALNYSDLAPVTNAYLVWLIALPILVALQFWTYWTDHPARAAAVQASVTIVSGIALASMLLGD